MRLALILWVVAGCGGAAVPSPPTANDPGYPAGPYGYEPAYPRHPPDVIPDLLFTGKVIPVGGDAASTPAQMISLGSLRGAGVRFLVLAAAAGWCSDCVGDEPSWAQLEAKYGPQGVVGVEILDEANMGVAPTLADLDRWSATYGTSGVVALDDKLAFETAAGIDAFPTYFIIDALNMTIARVSSQPLVAFGLDAALDELLAQ